MLIPNGEVKIEQTSCEKMNALTQENVSRISKSEKVSERGVKVLRTSFRSHLFANDYKCFALIDTSKGSMECEVANLFTEDGGKTTFGYIYHHTCR